jgi:hypothetical protein
VHDGHSHHRLRLRVKDTQFGEDIEADQEQDFGRNSNLACDAKLEDL